MNKREDSLRGSLAISLSFVMFLALIGFIFALFVAQSVGQILGLRRRNLNQREKLFSELGVEDVSKKKIVGFFHPYW